MISYLRLTFIKPRTFTSHSSRTSTRSEAECVGMITRPKDGSH